MGFFLLKNPAKSVEVQQKQLMERARVTLVPGSIPSSSGNSADISSLNSQFLRKLWEYFLPEFPFPKEVLGNISLLNSQFLGLFPHWIPSSSGNPGFISLLNSQFLPEHEVFLQPVLLLIPTFSSGATWGWTLSPCNDSKLYPSKITSQHPLNPSFTLFKEKGEMGFKEKEAISAI